MPPALPGKLNLWVLLEVSALTALDEDPTEDLGMRDPLRGPILLAALAALAAAAVLMEAGALPCPPCPCNVRQKAEDSVLNN